MPISGYNKYFAKKGDTTGAAEKLLKNLVKEYGDKKGKQIFYAMLAKRKRINNGGEKKGK